MISLQKCEDVERRKRERERECACVCTLRFSENGQPERERERESWWDVGILFLLFVLIQNKSTKG